MGKDKGEWGLGIREGWDGYEKSNRLGLLGIMVDSKWCLTGINECCVRASLHLYHCRQGDFFYLLNTKVVISFTKSTDNGKDESLYVAIFACLSPSTILKI